MNGLLVGAVLLFLAPLFYYTPRPTLSGMVDRLSFSLLFTPYLSAIVMSAGISLIDIGEMRFLWKVKQKYDLAELLLVFIVTLFFGPEIGALFAIIVSVIVVCSRSVYCSFLLIAFSDYIPIFQTQLFDIRTCFWYYCVSLFPSPFWF